MRKYLFIFFILFFTIEFILVNIKNAYCQEGEFFQQDQTIVVVNKTKKTVEDMMYIISIFSDRVSRLSFSQVFFLLRNQLVFEALFENVIKFSGIELNLEMKKILFKVKMKALIKNIIHRLIQEKINDQTIKCAYKQYVQNFLQNHKESQAKHILVSIKQKAKDVITIFESGAKFEDLALNLSKDVISSYRGGDLGYFFNKNVVYEFSYIVFRLFVSEFTKIPIRSNLGWHIIVKINEREAIPINFNSIKMRLTQNIFQNIIEEYTINFCNIMNVCIFSLNGSFKDLSNFNKN